MIAIGYGNFSSLQVVFLYLLLVILLLGPGWDLGIPCHTFFLLQTVYLLLLERLSYFFFYNL